MEEYSFLVIPYPRKNGKKAESEGNHYMDDAVSKIEKILDDLLCPTEKAVA